MTFEACVCVCVRMCVCVCVHAFLAEGMVLNVIVVDMQRADLGWVWQPRSSPDLRSREFSTFQGRHEAQAIGRFRICAAGVIYILHAANTFWEKRVHRRGENVFAVLRVCFVKHVKLSGFGCGSVSICWAHVYIARATF